jgi:Flp pilus assembly pilin Flp
MRGLWNDECGAILSAELILLVTMLVIGIVAGLKVLQDAINTELADVANAIGSINQSFSWSGASASTCAGSAGSSYADVRDSGDIAGANGGSGSSVVVCGNGPTPEAAP